MIKIRYCHPNEISPGLHAAAERYGRGTVVFLLCGLTVQQRRSALRRLRLFARMGYCPALPGAQLALALLVDRVRTGVGRAGAVFRLHPVGSTLPVMVVSAGAIAFLLFSAGSIRDLHIPRTPSQLQVVAAPVASADVVPVPIGPRGQLAGGFGGPGRSGSSGGPASAAERGSSGPTVNSAPAVPGSPAVGASAPGPGSGPGPGSTSGGNGTSPSAPQVTAAITASASTGSASTGSASTGSATTASATTASATTASATTAPATTGFAAPAPAVTASSQAPRWLRPRPPPSPGQPPRPAWAVCAWTSACWASA